ncbi:hypothetical protein DXG01_004270 [Tephrocybe rancida]|nr:hypothetical protein DXG01_004270 [Tephrocybe rancida]
MSVTEAGTSVLQPLTNGDINVISIVQDESHDASKEESLQLKEELKTVTDAEPVAKAAQITVEALTCRKALNPLDSKLDNVLNIPSSTETVVPPSEEVTVPKVNGVSEVHGTDVAASAAAQPDNPTAPAEQQATSAAQEAIPEPKEAIVEQQTVLVKDEEESPAEIAKVVESADLVAAPVTTAPAPDVLLATPSEVTHPTVEDKQAATIVIESKSEQSPVIDDEPIAAAPDIPKSTLVETVAPETVSEIILEATSMAEPEPEPVLTAATPDPTPSNSEAPPVETPAIEVATFAAEPAAEAAPAAAAEHGIPASIPTEGAVEEAAIQPESTSSVTEPLPVAISAAEDISAVAQGKDITEAVVEVPVEPSPEPEITDEVEAIIASESVPVAEESSPAVEPSVVEASPEVSSAEPETVAAAPLEATLAVVEPSTTTEEAITSEVIAELVEEPAESVEAREEAVETIVEQDPIPSADKEIAFPEPTPASIVEVPLPSAEVTPPAPAPVEEIPAPVASEQAIEAEVSIEPSAEIAPMSLAEGTVPVVHPSEPAVVEAIVAEPATEATVAELETEVVVTEPVVEVKVAEPIVELVAGSVAEEKVEEPIVEEVAAGPVEEKELAKSTIEVVEKAEPVVEETIAEPVTNEIVAAPAAGEVFTEAVVGETIAEPIVENIAEPVVEETVVAPAPPAVEETIAERPVDDAEPVGEEEVAEPTVAAPGADEAAAELLAEEKVAEPTVEEVAEPAEEIVAVPVAEEVIAESLVEEKVTEPTIEDAVPTFEEVVTEPAAEEKVAEPTVEEIAEPSTVETIAQPAVEEVVAEPAVDETIVESTVEDAEPVAEEKVAEFTLAAAAAEELVAQPVVAEKATEPTIEEVVATPAVEEAITELLDKEGVTEPTVEEVAEVAAEEAVAAPAPEEAIAELTSEETIAEPIAEDVIQTAADEIETVPVVASAEPVAKESIVEPTGEKVLEIATEETVAAPEEVVVESTAVEPQVEHIAAVTEETAVTPEESIAEPAAKEVLSEANIAAEVVAEPVVENVGEPAIVDAVSKPTTEEPAEIKDDSVIETLEPVSVAATVIQETSVEDNSIASSDAPVEEPAEGEISSPATVEESAAIPSIETTEAEAVSGLNSESAVVEPTQTIEAIGQASKEPAEVDDALRVGGEIERPKSPWTPSFQVTTVGRGASPDQQAQEPEPAVSATEVSTTGIEQESQPVEVPAAIVDLELAKDIEQPSVSPPELYIDKSSLDETADTEEPSDAPIDEPPRSWTPSYSVHSQGSPRPDHAELEAEAQEPPARPWTPSYSVHSQGSPIPTDIVLDEEPTLLADGEAVVAQEEEAVELEEMKFADNEEAPVPAPSVPSVEEEQSQDEMSEILEQIKVPTVVALTSQNANEETERPLEPTSAEVSAEPVNAVLEAPSIDVATTDVRDVLTEQSAVAHEAEFEGVVKDEAVSVQVPELVLDVSEKVLASSASEETPGGLVPRSEERPTSPSWVASYSVSVQGSPAQERSNPLDDIAIPETSLTESEHTELESPPEPTAVEQFEVLITETENIVGVESQELAVLDVAAPTVEDSKVKISAEDIIEDSAINDTPATAPSLALENTERGASLVSDLTKHFQDGAPTSVPEHDNQEPPKSPWTASYSVTTQGTTSASDEAELNDLEPLSQPANVEATQAEDAVPHDALPDSKPEDDVPSVTAEAAEVAVNTAAVFPSVLSAVEESKKSKSSNLRLTTLDENATSEGSSASPDPPSPVTGRSRLQSTTSSRFFPGGWFSPTKTVDETRASLEIAQGEFTAAKLAAINNPSIDEGPAVETPTPAQTVNEEPQSATSEEKRRCGKSKGKGISVSSFLDLKAEISKQEDEFVRSKVSGKGNYVVGGVKRPDKKPTVWARQNKGLQSRASRDVELEAVSKPTLESARAALERKAKIYDKLRKGKTGGLNDKQYDALLVDFDSKPGPSNYESDSDDVDESVEIARPPSNEEDDPMVEYEDEFGRLKTARRSEVPRSLAPAADEPDEDEDIIIRNPVNHFPVYEPSAERVAEIAATYAEENNPLNAHYDASRENRAKGAGFYQFSGDEETRRRQMEELKAARDETGQIREELGAIDVRPGEVEGMRDTGEGARSRAMEKRKRELEERRKLVDAKRRKVTGEAEATTSQPVLTATSIVPATVALASIPPPPPLDPLAALEAKTKFNRDKGKAKTAPVSDADTFLAQLEHDFRSKGR